MPLAPGDQHPGASHRRGQKGPGRELVVPDEFRDKLKRDPVAEMERIETLYRIKVITKEKFGAAIKILAADDDALSLRVHRAGDARRAGAPVLRGPRRVTRRRARRRA